MRPAPADTADCTHEPHKGHWALSPKRGTSPTGTSCNGYPRWLVEYIHVRRWMVTRSRFLIFKMVATTSTSTSTSTSSALRANAAAQLHMHTLACCAPRTYPTYPGLTISRLLGGFGCHTHVRRGVPHNDACRSAVCNARKVGGHTSNSI